MKKNSIILILLLAAGAVSCTSDDVAERPLGTLWDETSPVEFGIYASDPVSDVSRATSLTAGDVKAASIGVFAFHQGAYGLEDYLDTKQGYTPNFMYNQKLEYQSDKWTYSPIKYWPGSQRDKVSFFAYAPYNEHLGVDGVVTPFNNLMLQDVPPVDGYRLQLGYDHMGPGIEYFISDDPAQGVDLLWGARQGTTPAVSPFDLTRQGTGDRVQLEMKHALSRLDFDVQVWTNAVAATGATNNAIPAGTTVSIRSVSLKGNFAGRGTLRLYDGTWQKDLRSMHDLTFRDDQGQFSTAVHDGLDGEDTKTAAVPLLAGIHTTTATDVKNNYVMVLPDVTFYFEIVYDVTTVDNTNPQNTSVITNTVRSTDLNAGHSGSTDGWYTLRQGCAYMFHLTIGLRTIVFDVQMDDWTHKTQPDIPLPLS